MSIDPAFEGVGTVPGLTLWRIENKVVVKQPVVSSFTGGMCRGRLESKGGLQQASIVITGGGHCVRPDRLE